MKEILKKFKPVIILELHYSLDSAIVEIYPILRDCGYLCYSTEDWIKEDKVPLNSFNKEHHIIAV